MTISFVNATSTATNATPSTATHPTGITADDWLVLLANSKPTSRVPTAPADWTNNGNIFGGVGASGSDTGITRLTYWSQLADGAETGTFTITWSTAPTAQIAELVFHKTVAGSWSTAFAFGDDSTQSTGAGAISVTPATDPGFTTGDLVVVTFGLTTDAGLLLNPAITVPGCSVGTVTERVLLQSAVGNDGGIWVLTAAITAGTSTGAPTFTAETLELNASAGPGLFVRLREPAGGSTATAASTLPALTTQATGTARSTSSAASTLPSLTSAAAATASATASATSLLPAPTTATAATARATATVASTLPAPTTAATATARVFVSVANTLPALGQAATGTVAAPASAASVLPALTQAAIASARSTATAASTLPALTTQAVGTVEGVTTATAASTLPVLVTTATASVRSTATAALTFPSLTSSATATATASGTASSLLAAVTSAALAGSSASAVIATVLPSVVSAGRSGPPLPLIPGRATAVLAPAAGAVGQVTAQASGAAGEVAAQASASSTIREG